MDYKYILGALALAAGGYLVYKKGMMPKKNVPAITIQESLVALGPQGEAPSEKDFDMLGYYRIRQELK